MLKNHLDPNIDLSSRNHLFIDRSVAWMVSHFKVDSESRIADFGCGPGLYTTRLARHGAQVTGIDFSATSIQYAEQVAAREGLKIHYVHQDYLAFDTSERFDLILMIMCDFCAMSPGQRHTMLEKFRRLLKPDGCVLLDVYSLAAFAERKESVTFQFNLMDGFWSPNDYFGFLNVFAYPGENLWLDKYTIVEQDRTRTFYNWFQCFDAETLKDEFAECGLAICQLFADVVGSPWNPEGEEFAVVAKADVSE